MTRSSPVIRAVVALMEAAPPPRALRTSQDAEQPVGFHAHERDGEAPCIIVREPLGPARLASQTAVRGLQLETLIEVPKSTYSSGYDGRAYLESLHAWTRALLHKHLLEGAGFDAPIPVALYTEPTTAEHDGKRSVLYSYAAFTVALLPT